MNMENTLKSVSLAISVVLFSVTLANAHVSEQGIVLLLPTDIYIISGCLAVIASMLMVTLLPKNLVARLFKPVQIPLRGINSILNNTAIRDGVSIFSLAVTLALIVIGAIGSRDPLVNILPLTIWTLWWIAIFMLHCIIGNLWSWINPWIGLYNLLFKGAKSWLTLPEKLGQWPAIVLYVSFYIFIIADLAPDDPARLSNVVLGYLVFTFLGMIVFGGEAWLNQVECFSVLFRLVSRLAPIQINPNGEGLLIGLPGWQAIQGERLTSSQAFFLLSVLACGSFDGVNETFWWLVQIDVNPLAFPGRSAVVMESTTGILIANLLLYALFAVCVWIGIYLVVRSRKTQKNSDDSGFEFMGLLSALAISVLPIAAVYHGSHYMTSFMVNGQYLIAALSDPLANGSNYLGLENYQVTTGYLNQISSVQKIWFTQASIVIFGHIIAVLMAHFAIEKHFSNRKEAILFHIPVAIFMAAYTWFGLWLLAAPKGA